MPGSKGPSWLTFLGHTTDSLWNMDLFRTESILLKSHWVLVVMDQFSRRIIGFAVQPRDIDGHSLCGMFNQIIAGTGLPRRLSFDNAPLFDFAQWKTNLQILEIDPIRSVLNVPVSHPFIERLIGTVSREFLDHLFYWNSADLFRKLDSFKTYYNGIRVHQGIQGDIPDHEARDEKSPAVSLHDFAWESHCNGLFQMPMAA
ncbi:MAG TPA: transposase [Verrucomicrobia bacterium]|nr:transposase [Verrucomicrobiota bacterium]